MVKWDWPKVLFLKLCSDVWRASPPYPPQGGTTSSLDGTKEKTIIYPNTYLNLFRSCDKRMGLSPLEGGRGVMRPIRKNIFQFVFFIFSRSKFGIYYFSFFIFFLSCKKEKPITITPAFYHWQTHLQLTPAERQLMDSINAKKIYAKYFDIDLNESKKPLPQAVIKINYEYLNNIEIVPTIFITNRVFKNISKKEIEGLADNILKKINALHGHIPMEVQFDCDWTQSTRDNFFYFLKYFKTLATHHSSLVTSTIRLHQLKYPEKTGVPPVDKGMLMFYNVGELDDWETENSILDIALAEKYLIPNTQYPLPLDIALPIFKWGVVFRNNELVYLINNLGKNELMDKGHFKKINKNRYAVIKSTYLNGTYLYENDWIRLEKTTPELLERAAENLSKFIKSGKFMNNEMCVSFYHLDTTTLKSFHQKDFEKILGRFSD